MTELRTITKKQNPQNSISYHYKVKIQKNEKYFVLINTISKDLGLPERDVLKARNLFKKILETPFTTYKNPLIYVIICVYFASNKANYEVSLRYLLSRYKNINPEQKFFRKTQKYYQNFLKELNLTHPKTNLKKMINRFLRDQNSKIYRTLNEPTQKLAQNLRIYSEFKNKSNSLISAVAILFVSRSNNIQISSEKIQKYFKVSYHSLTKIYNVVEEKLEHLINSSIISSKILDISKIEKSNSYYYRKKRHCEKLINTLQSVFESKNFIDIDFTIYDYIIENLPKYLKHKNQIIGNTCNLGAGIYYFLALDNDYTIKISNLIEILNIKKRYFNDLIRFLIKLPYFEKIKINTEEKAKKGRLTELTPLSRVIIIRKPKLEGFDIVDNDEMRLKTNITEDLDRRQRKIVKIYNEIFLNKIKSDISIKISKDILDFIKIIGYSGRNYRDLIIQAYKVFIKAYLSSKKLGDIDDIDYTDDFLKIYFSFPTKFSAQKFLYHEYKKFTNQNFPVLSNEILFREIFYLFEFFSIEGSKSLVPHISKLYVKYKIKSFFSTGFIPALIYISAESKYTQEQLALFFDVADATIGKKARLLKRNIQESDLTEFRDLLTKENPNIYEILGKSNRFPEPEIKDHFKIKAKLKDLEKPIDILSSKNIIKKMNLFEWLDLVKLKKLLRIDDLNDAHLLELKLKQLTKKGIIDIKIEEDINYWKKNYLKYS